MKPGFRQQPEDDRIAHLRVPPNARDSEQAVIGGLLLAPDAWDLVADILSPEDFFGRDHRLIFEAIRSMQAARKPFDVVTLGEWFDANGTAEQIGGSAYLIELASTTPSAANIRAYAEIVREKSILRSLIEAGTLTANDGFAAAGRDPMVLAGEAMTRIGQLLESAPCDLEPIVPVMRRVFDSLSARFDAGGGITGQTTGLKDLDELTCGLSPGQLVILAARPSMGKTSLAQNFAEHVAVEGRKPVAVFSLEMQPDELGERLLSSLGDVDAGRVRRADLDDVDWSNVNAALKRLHGAPLLISKPKAARVEHIVAQTRRQHARAPLALVVIDYLQLIEVEGDNTAQAYAKVTRALKLMAGDLKIPVILLSQLNRNLEVRNDKRPKLSDLRDSGAIEQDADVVIFIYRDEVYDSKSRDKGTAELIVAKQRNGRTDTVRVKYQGDRYRFSNLPDGWEPAPVTRDDDAPKPRRRGFGGNYGRDRASGDS